MFKNIIVLLIGLYAMNANATPLSAECKGKIYAAALPEIAKNYNPFQNGSPLTLEKIELIENTTRSYAVSFHFEDGTKTEGDTSGQIKVVLKNLANVSCEVKYAKALID